MSDCDDCKSYWYEHDTNAAGCKEEMDEKYWFTNKKCPKYESAEDFDEAYDRQRDDNDI